MVMLMNEPLYLSVEEQIQDLIRNKDLTAGTPLPSERALAEQFHVSRNVIRQALNELAQKNIIDIIPKRGALVSFNSDENIFKSLRQMISRNANTHLDYLEAREVLEVAIIEKCIPHVSDEFLSNLNDIWNRMEDYRRRRKMELFLKSDREFHETIAKQIPNQLFYVLLRTVFIQNPDIFSISKAVEETAYEDTQNEHRMMIDGLTRRNKEICKMAVFMTFDNIRRDLKTIQDARN